MIEKITKGKKLTNRLNPISDPKSEALICFAVPELQNGQARPGMDIIITARIIASLLNRIDMFFQFIMLHLRKRNNYWAAVIVY